MNQQQQIHAFFDGDAFAVVGASRDREKYGNKVLRAYLQNDLKVYPVNPTEKQIEGLRAYPDLASLPEPVHGISIVTPPEVTEKIVQQAAEAGIKHVWMQPGAESESAIARANQLGLNTIAAGPCALVALGFHE